MCLARGAEKRCIDGLHRNQKSEEVKLQDTHTHVPSILIMVFLASSQLF